MSLLRPEKVAVVDELKQQIEDSSIAIATQYVGINVEDVTELRKKLRESDVTFKVYKNTLVKRALDDLGLSDAVQFMDGPTAWAFCKDPVIPAKVIKDFAKGVKVLQMNGGILDGKVVDKDAIDALASLPPRDMLIAQVVGTIAAPLRNLVGTLSAVPRNFVNVLDQIRKQKEEGAAAA